ncbi:unnamed protein product [Effrenium voratum]|nr:unnamed protein product [Effrenium voratum]
MAMPLWVPSRELAYRLQSFVPWGMVSYSGSWRHQGPSQEEEGPWWEAPEPREESAPGFAFPPFFNAQTAPYPLAKAAYWYEFGEFVSYPGVQDGSPPCQSCC